MTVAKPLTSSQRQSLLTLLHCVLKEVRLLAWEGKSEQAGDLADAITPLPLLMNNKEFNWQAVYRAFSCYQERHREALNSDYLRLIKVIENS